MPFALLIAGILLLVAGVRNTQDTLFTLVKSDFTGQDNFLYWFVAMIVIGGLGYIPKLKPISVGLLALIILVLFLSKGKPGGAGGGFFGQFTSALNTTQSATPASGLSPLAQQQATTQNLLNQLQPYLELQP